MKKKKQSSLNVAQLKQFLDGLNLSNDRLIKGPLQNALRTGDPTHLNRVIQKHMRAIQRRMMLIQLEAEKAEADPFYLRPTTDQFTGCIPIALIPDLFEQQPGRFIMDVGDFMRHMFVCGSPGTGKSRGILSIIKILKEL